MRASSPTAQRRRSSPAPSARAISSRNRCICSGQGYGLRHSHIGDTELTTTGAVDSGRDAFRTAGLTPADVDVAQIYDCFTITVIVELEDLGFCKKGEGGPSSRTGASRSAANCRSRRTAASCRAAIPGSAADFSTCIEAVRQLRGEAGARQVKDAEVALVHGNGGVISIHCTLLLGDTEE